MADNRGTSARRRLAVIAAAASLVILGGVAAIAAVLDGTETTIEVAAVTTGPLDFGEWSPISEAPIEARPYAATAWTGSEVVFWAGSNLDRDYAYTDGAAYEPLTDSWRELSVPGWGHPGLTAAFFDGELYALAKGGGTRFDTARGEWNDLPAVQGMFLAATVATDTALWGLGPAGQNPFGQPDLAIAEYDPETNTWSYGPVFEGTEELAAIVPGLARLETSVVWTGREIVVWSSLDGGVAYEPESRTWRSVIHPALDQGAAAGSIATVTDRGLTVLVDTGGTSRIAYEMNSGWAWLGTELPLADFDSVTVAPAEQWLVVFAAQESPAIVHMPSGAWERDDDGPLGRVEGVNTAWTGAQLVAWGGERSAGDVSAGAVWRPPDGPY